MIPTKKQCGHPSPFTMRFFTGKGGYFELSLGSETFEMTSEGLGEMLEGDSADATPEKNSACVNGGLSGGSSVGKPGR